MNSEYQFDLFDPANEPALLQPVADCTEADQEDRIRSPTDEPPGSRGILEMTAGQRKNADSLRRKSRELVKKSKCFINNKQNENIQQHEHPRP